jgi:Cu-Zn family superoxide dismutase
MNTAIPLRARSLGPTLLTVLLLLALSACSTTEEVTEDAGDLAAEGAEATAEVAEETAGFVVDAAGTAWDTVTDLFDDDADADAAALVRPTDAGSAQGTVKFYETDDGLRVHVSLRDLSPGDHGFHIHQNADCSAADTDGDGVMEPAGAAGAHWDPHDTNDHSAPGDAIPDKHLGDLGNVTASADGTVETTITVDTYRPDEHDLAGRSIVVHSGRDDLVTDPAGDSGTPVACGVIEGR